jgi:glycosyltransferase involved in cell wall biosynthesis
MRITLVLPTLACGGAERAALAIANHWAQRGYKITILTFDKKNTPPFYEVSSLIEHVQLDLAKNSHQLFARIWNNLRRIIILRKAIKDSSPSIVISFLNRTNIRTLLATRGSSVPVIISEQTDPLRGNLEAVWRWLQKYLYSSASRVVAHTEQAAQYLTETLNCRAVVIPNPVVETAIKPKITQQLTSILIAVGALEKEKGFDILLQSVAQIVPQHPQLVVRIFGEGTQRDYLESLRAKLGLTRQVDLPGQVKNIFQQLSEADLFVMPSRIEGFGNALCEAMACGLPVIATDCMGPREIIRDGETGILVPVEDVKTLARVISELLENAEKRRFLATQAREIMRRVSLEEVMKRWDGLLVELS